ncbi:unnamed protein product [Phytomonas sp. EM1]|nr:unnamed protein product [Phytomonas sp. EM1]|eukprot:CCW64808.1 unnamed protein product [Phytomonas sp. isolate EM1]
MEHLRKRDTTAWTEEKAREGGASVNNTTLDHIDGFTGAVNRDDDNFSGSNVRQASQGPGSRCGGVSPNYNEEDRHIPLRWFLHVVIAILVGMIATLVLYLVEFIESWRFNTLDLVIHSSSVRMLSYSLGLVFFVSVSVGLAAVAGAVVVYVEPAAAGGGIPDVITYLNGVHLPRAMNVRTFAAKAISCVCAVASGLPVGLEAPLIHLGAITGAGVTQGRSRTLGFQTSFFQEFRNHMDRREFITAGAACGVSTAFGAPIGGLLFVMEEMCSFWDHTASGRIFLATMLCFTMSSIINSLVENQRPLGWISNTVLLLFEVDLMIPLKLISIVPSLLLGAMLGALAALFTKVNLILIKWRRQVLLTTPLRRFLEPVLLASLYSALIYSFSFHSMCYPFKDIANPNETICVWGTEPQSYLFNSTCTESGTYTPFGTLSMDTGKKVIRHLFTRQTILEFPGYTLLCNFVIYFAFACLSSGAAVSGGLVVPSLVIGATFGRLFGLFLWHMGSTGAGVDRGYLCTDAWMDPGVFALIGAGAFLAGTSRMTISICVIMVELSSELHYLLPVMVAIVVSKSVADRLSKPLYHEILHLSCVPYLSANLPHPDFEQLAVADVMSTNVVILRRRERTEVVLSALLNTTHHAFPVVEATYESGDRTQCGGRTLRCNVTGDGPRQGNIPSTSPDGDWSRGPRYKFVGLVTREDLQVYFTLPNFREFPPSPSSWDNAKLPPNDPESDGFGGRLAPSVQVINRMSWEEWHDHKTSLFLKVANHDDWVKFHAPLRGDDIAPRSQYYSTAAIGAAAADGNALLAASPEHTHLPKVVDLSLILNRSPWVVTPFFNLHMCYKMFRSMGLRHLVVVDGDEVCGMITRKDLLVGALRRQMRKMHSRLATRGEGDITTQHNEAFPIPDRLYDVPDDINNTEHTLLLEKVV